MTDLCSSSRAPLDRLQLQDAVRGLPLGRLWLEAESGSTNTELAALAESGAAGHLSVYCTEYQSAGKGRLGRTWSTPAGSALTLSVLAGPGADMPAESLSWYTMLAAVALVQAIEQQAGVQTAIKWPNDLLAGGKKACGILAQLVSTPDGFAVVVGTGLNVDQAQDELPVPTATSLRLAAGRPVDRQQLLAGYLRTFAELDAAFAAVRGNALAPLGLAAHPGASLHQLVAGSLATLGTEVRVEFPDDTVFEGIAEALAPDGGLLVRGSAGAVRHVLAGDVHHVRRADGKYA